MKFRIAAILFAVVALPAMVLYWLSAETELRVEPEVSVIGVATPVRVVAVNPHGVRRFVAAVEQDGSRQVVHETSEPASRFLFWRRNDAAREFQFTAGTKGAPALKDGKAVLHIEADSNDFRGRTTTVAIGLRVNTRPPALAVDGHQHYINQGGAELVTFTVSGYWTEAGVRVGGYTFRSFPFPGTKTEDDGRSQRFSLFAFPWNVPADTVPFVYSRNPAGAEVTARFWSKVFPKRFRTRELALDDGFLEKVVTAIDPAGTGDLLGRFLKINGELRLMNNQALADLRHQTEERVLWSGPFLQLANTKVESHFADVRTYTYQGRKVDQQVHLGFDLSSTRNAPVRAANDGIVRYAADLGIYGNTVVVDHGYGLQSIYAHLSRVDVKPGDEVVKNQPLGLTGETGLAGGDHLHFSMQVDGVQVNPIEWWDPEWIRNRILSKIPPRADAGGVPAQ